MKRLALVLAAVTLAAGAATAACLSEDPRYVYTAQRFDPAAGCLEDYAPVETVPGDTVLSTCPAACLTVDGEVYVSTVCPPLPDIASPLEPSDPACQAALEAARREVSCSDEEGAEPEDDAGAADADDDGG